MLARKVLQTRAQGSGTRARVSGDLAARRYNPDRKVPRLARKVLSVARKVLEACAQGSDTRARVSGDLAARRYNPDRKARRLARKARRVARKVLQACAQGSESRGWGSRALRPSAKRPRGWTGSTNGDWGGLPSKDSESARRLRFSGVPPGVATATQNGSRPALRALQCRRTVAAAAGTLHWDGLALSRVTWATAPAA